VLAIEAPLNQGPIVAGLWTIGAFFTFLSTLPAKKRHRESISKLLRDHAKLEERVSQLEGINASEELERKMEEKVRTFLGGGQRPPHGRHQ